MQLEHQVLELGSDHQMRNVIQPSVVRQHNFKSQDKKKILGLTSTQALLLASCLVPDATRFSSVSFFLVLFDELLSAENGGMVIEALGVWRERDLQKLKQMPPLR